MESTPEQIAQARRKLYGDDPLDAGRAPSIDESIPGGAPGDPMSPLRRDLVPAMPQEVPSSNPVNQTSTEPLKSAAEREAEGGQQDPSAMPSFSPGGWTNLGRTLTTQGGLNPQAIKAMATQGAIAGAAGNEAIKLETRAAQEEAKLREINAVKKAAMYGGREAEIALDRIQSNQDFNAFMGRRQKVSDEIFSQKIDPERKWHDASTGSKIAASIAMVLGGIGAGLTHGPNMAVETIENIIKHDIQGQEMNLQKNRAKLADMDGSYAMFLRQGDSEKDAKAKAFALDLQKTMDMFDASMAGVNNDRALAIGAKTKQALAMSQMQIIDHLARAQGTSSSSVTQAYAPPGGTQTRLPLSEDLSKRLVLIDGGKHAVFANGPDAAAKIQEKTQSLESVQDIVAEMAKLNEEWGSKIPTTEAHALMNSAVAEFKQEWTRAKGQGVLSGGDERLANDIIHDPSNLLSGSNRSVFARINDRLHKNKMNVVRGLPSADAYDYPKAFYGGSREDFGPQVTPIQLAPPRK